MDSGVDERLEQLGPLEFYRNYIKAEHASNVSAFFEDLLQQSSVDEGLNKKIIKELRKLETDSSKARGKRSLLRFVLGFLILSVAVFTLFLFLYPRDTLSYLPFFVTSLFHSAGRYLGLWGFLSLPTLISLLPLYIVFRYLSKVSHLYKSLEKNVAAARSKAWEQLKPLNRLFDWGIALKLVQQTCPFISFNDYLTDDWLQEIAQEFQCGTNLGKNWSVMDVHSGVLNSNPFLLVRVLAHHMGTRTYSGTLSISWTTRERDSEGNWRTVTHHETLRASVTKPFPEYSVDSFILYANKAAPNLVFKRSPSKLSELGDGTIDQMRKQMAIRRLEKKSLKSNKNFTVMSNREFDALFGAQNRNDEVEFRLLFTPIAQREMLSLLKDQTVSGGDNFSFYKDHMINQIRSKALRELELSGDPKKFFGYEVADIRTFFNNYHNEFMRSLYFALAPILAIPIYQQTKFSKRKLDQLSSSKGSLSHWEQESIANHYQASAFSHPKSATRNILKTKLLGKTEDNMQTVKVTASGFRVNQRVDYIRVYGGDGRYHNVPVPWDEYLPVHKDSEFLVGHTEDISEPLSDKLRAETAAVNGRGSLFSTRKED